LTVPTLVDLSTSDYPVAVATEVHHLLAGLVAGGAALGWVDPPPYDEVAALLADVVSDAGSGDAAILGAYSENRLVGFGYWRRYTRATHRPNADLEKLAVAPTHQGRGVGRALTSALIAAARTAGIEVLTLDLRGDNASALALYRSLGFEEYGRLARFVAVGDRRYDKLFLAIDLRPGHGEGSP
jgi:ribosomal protein S18 acetylase RimI-like enzyme